MICERHGYFADVFWISLMTFDFKDENTLDSLTSTYCDLTLEDMCSIRPEVSVKRIAYGKQYAMLWWMPHLYLNNTVASMVLTSFINISDKHTTPVHTLLSVKTRKLHLATMFIILNTKTCSRWNTLQYRQH